MIQVKNNKAESDTWAGMQINPTEYYEIQKTELQKWQNDTKVLVDVASGDLIINNGTDDILDVAAAINHLKQIIVTEVDIDGRQIVRAAAGKPGWTYMAHPVEFQTAKFNSIYEKNHLGTSREISSLRFYDANNAEVLLPENEAAITKTVVLFKPGYDFELISGQLQQITSPASNLRIWVIGGIVEIGGAYVKEFCGGVNMKFLSANEALKTDGRAAKFMKKDIADVPYQANQIQVIIRHDAGYQHDLMLFLEYFRA
jgi:hypothetical protein